MYWNFLRSNLTRKHGSVKYFHKREKKIHRFRPVSGHHILYSGGRIPEYPYGLSRIRIYNVLLENSWCRRTKSSFRCMRTFGSSHSKRAVHVNTHAKKKKDYSEKNNYRKVWNIRKKRECSLSFSNYFFFFRRKKLRPKRKT